MPDPHSPWSGPSDADPARPNPRPGAEPAPQPQYEFAGTPGHYSTHSGTAAPQGQFSGSGPQYSSQAYGDAFFSGEQPAKRRNTVGIIALVVAVLGAIFSVVPGAAILGWILLPFGFVLGIVGLFMSGKPKGTAIGAVVVSIVGTIMAMVFFVAVVSDAFDSAFDEDVTVSQSDSGDSNGGEAASAAASGDQSIVEDEVGTRANPSAIGDVLGSNDWEVVVNSFTRNATDQVMAANSFNDPPPPGSQYALVNLTATYVGEESGLADFITAAFVTDNGNVIRSYDHSAVTPDPLEGELYTGASATGNVDLAIPEGEPGLLRLDLGTFGGGEVFVAVD